MSIYEMSIKNPKKIAEFYKQLCEQKDIEIKQLKEQLNKYTDPKDLTLMFMYCDEKAKDKIKCLEQENQQLKEKLEASEKARKEAIEYIKELYDNTDDTTCYDIDKVEKEILLQILDIDKGE